MIQQQEFTLCPWNDSVISPSPLDDAASDDMLTLNVISDPGFSFRKASRAGEIDERNPPSSDSTTRAAWAYKAFNECVTSAQY